MYNAIFSFPHNFGVFQALTVSQIRPIVKSIDAAIAQNNEDRLRTEEERGESVKEIGNMLHETCIISNDEVTGNQIRGLNM